MCRHVYHHYQGCGHISNYTMESCCAFTNQLRMFATIGDLPTKQSYSTCDDIDTFHDILPEDYPDFCLKCAYDWSDRQIGDSKPSPQPSTVVPIEGLEAVHPIFDIQARMVVNTSLDTAEMRHTWRSDRDLESENSLSSDFSLHLEPLVECDALETQVGPNLRCPSSFRPQEHIMEYGWLYRVYTWLHAQYRFGGDAMSLTSDHPHDAMSLTSDHTPQKNLLFITMLKLNSETDICQQVHELSEKGDESDAVLTNLEWDWLRNPMGHPVPPPSPPCPDVSEETECTERSLASRSSGFACISHAGPQEDDEEMPFSVTNSLAQLDLDCTDESFSSRPSSSSTNKIDLLSTLPSREEILTELVQVFKQQASSPNFSHATFDTYQDSPETRPLLLKGFRCSESRSTLWRADMSSASSPNFGRSRPALNADDWLSELDDFTLLWTYRRSYVKEKREEEDLESSTQSFYTADENEDDEEDEEEGGCSLL